jgi:hypothetical protein
MSAMFKVQESIYNALIANNAVTTSVTGIYDQPPVNAKYPYITIGNMTELSNNRLYDIGFRVTANIDIYAKTGRGGTKQVKEILEKVNNVLNLKILSLSGYTMVQIYYTDSEVIKNDDITQVSANYTILAE